MFRTCVRFLLLVIGLLPLAGCGEADSVDDHWGDTFHGEVGIELFQPIGTIDVLPDYFRWSTATAANYAVGVLDSEGNVLWKREGIPAPSTELGAEVRAIIRPGVRYTWQVLALEGGGIVRDGSPVGHFTLRAPES